MECENENPQPLEAQPPAAIKMSITMSPTTVTRAASPLGVRDCNRSAAMCETPPSKRATAAAALSTSGDVNCTLLQAPCSSSIALSPSKAGLLSPRRVFASPLRFVHTPPPAPLLAPTPAPLCSGVSSAAEEEEMLENSFALCKAAQQLLESSALHAQDQATEIAIAHDELIAAPIVEAFEPELAAEIQPLGLVEELPETFEAEQQLPQELVHEPQQDDETMDLVEAEIAREPITVVDPSQLFAAAQATQPEAGDAECEETLEEEAEPVPTCMNANCMAMIDLSENLSLEVIELNTRYTSLQEEGARLFKQYEIKCAKLKATQTHHQAQGEFIVQISGEHDTLRAEYEELYHAYQDLETLYNQNITEATTSTAEHERLIDENAQLREQLLTVRTELACTQLRAQEQQETQTKEKDELIASLRQQLLLAQADLTNATQQMQQLTQKSQELEGASDKEQQLQSQLQVEREQSRIELAQVRSDLDAVRIQLASTQSEAQARADEWSIITQGHATELQDAEAQIMALTATTQAKSITLERLELDLASAQQDLEQAQAQHAQTKIQLEAAEAMITQTAASSQTQHAQADTEKQELQAQLTAATSELEIVRAEAEQLPALRTQLTAVEESLAASSAQLEVAHSQLTMAHEQNTTLVQALRDQATEQIAEVTRAAGEADLMLALATDQRTALEQTLEAMNAQIADKDHQLETQDQLVANLRAEVQQLPVLQTMVSTLRNELAAAQTRASQNASLVASLETQLRERIDQHAYDLKCSAGVTGELEAELAQSTEAMAQTQRKAKDQKKKIDELRERLVEVETECASLRMNAMPAVEHAPLHTLKQLSAAQDEAERLESDLMASRRENATLTGRLQALETLSANETSTLRARLDAKTEEAELLRRTASASNSPAKTAEQARLLATKESELTNTKIALHHMRTQLYESGVEKEQLRADKEQLLVQVELLADTAAQQGDSTELTSQVSSLQAHCSELKAYMTQYKAAGDAKLAALSTKNARVVEQLSGLCNTLVKQGLVKRDNIDLYKLVQGAATLLKAPSATPQPTA